MIEARDYQAADALRDGTAVTVRAIRCDDGPNILSAFESLSKESIFTRFFTFKKGLTDAELRQIAEVDFENVVALVATARTPDGEKLVGGGRYVCEPAPGGPKSAELAFLTADNFKSRGIASLLLKHLVRIARDKGVSRFEADVLAQNQAMLEVFRRSGLAMTQRRDGEVVHVTLALDERPAAAL